MSKINNVVLKTKELSTDKPQREEDNSLEETFSRLGTKYGFIKQIKVLRKMLNNVLDKAEYEKLLADPLVDVLEDAEDVLGYIVYKAEKRQNRIKSDDDSEWSTAQKVATITTGTGFVGDISTEEGWTTEIYSDWDFFGNMN